MDMETCTSKRKQECLNDGTVHRNPDNEALKMKKQRRGNNFICRSDEIPSQFHAMLNGHSTVNGCQKVNMTSVEDEKLEIEGNMTEPMEYTEEMNSNSVEVNGNKPTFNTKLRAHGHLNSCTTYNSVPCRYHRMYCHPGGFMDDYLQTYHGF